MCISTSISDVMWVPCNGFNGELPSNAVRAGYDIDGDPIYVGRAFCDNDRMPATVIPKKKTAYISYGGKEVVVQRFDILCGTDFSWVRLNRMKVPKYAVCAGTGISSNAADINEPLYVGRAYFEDRLVVGKIHPSHGCMFVACQGREHRVLSQYDVLVVSKKLRWVATSTDMPLPSDAVQGGFDEHGTPLYVGRAYHEGDQLPGKIDSSCNVIYVSYAGGELAKHQYDVLCGTGYAWISDQRGHAPLSALRAGSTDYDERLLIGRANFRGGVIVGKIHPSHGCLYVPFDGVEHRIKEYEVLVES